MLCCAHFAVHLCDFPLLIDDVRNSFCVAVLRRFAGAVLHADIALCVAKEREWKAEFFCKTGIFFNRVEADSQNLDILFVVVVNSVAEPATFCGSTRRVCLWIKPQYDFLSPIIGKAHLFAGVVFYRKIGRHVSNLKESHIKASLFQAHLIIEKSEKHLCAVVVIIGLCASD